MKRLLFALLMSCSLAWGQGLEIIDLRHRSAEQLLPQLMPFVEPGGALTGMNGKLFMRASGRNRRDTLQQVLTIDGGRAAIMVGQSYFLPLRQLVMTPLGVIVSE